MLRSSVGWLVIAALGAVACSGSPGGSGAGDTPGSSGGVGASGGPSSSGGTSGGAGSSGGMPASPGLTLSAPGAVTIGRAGPLAIRVNLVRQGAVGPATVHLDGLTTGFTSDPVTVDAATSSATLLLRASDAASTTPLNVTIEASAGALTAKAPLRIDAPRGTFDSSFGAAGVVRVPFRAADALPLADGGVLVFGDQTTLGGLPILTRLDAAGAVDVTFGTAGSSVLPLAPTSDDNSAVALAAKGDGSFYALVRADATSYTGPALVHVLANGSLDATFGAAGYATMAVDGLNIATPTALAVQPDGKILMTATATSDSNSLSPSRALIARFTAAGQLDAAFGTNGRVTSSFDAANAGAHGLRAVDGQIYGCGSSTASASRSHGVIVRLDDAGNLDPTFGIGGFVTTTSPVDDVVKTPAGDLLLRMSQGLEGAMAEMTMAGALQTTFGDRGYLLNDSPLPGAGYANDPLPFAVDAVGRIHVLIGSITHERLEIWSFDANGQRETTFGGQGSLLVENLGGVPTPRVVRETPDGRDIALGSMPDATAPSVVLRFVP